jgi:hypothetical protein
MKRLTRIVQAEVTGNDQAAVLRMVASQRLPSLKSGSQQVQLVARTLSICYTGGQVGVLRYTGWVKMGSIPQG